MQSSQAWVTNECLSSPVMIRATHDVYLYGYVRDKWMKAVTFYAVEESEVWVDPSLLHRTGFQGPGCVSPSLAKNTLFLLSTSSWGQVWGGCQPHPVPSQCLSAQLGPQGPGPCILKTLAGHGKGRVYHRLGCQAGCGCLCLGITLTLGRPKEC